MEVMSTRTHGKVHMALALILLVLPRIMMWSSDSANAMNIIGAVMLVISLITNYELGLAKALPMRVHLLLDIPLALVMLATPLLLAHYLPTVQTGAAFITLLFCGITNFLTVLGTWRQNPAEYGIGPEQRQHLSPPIFD